MASGWNLRVWLQCICVVSGCCCNAAINVTLHPPPCTGVGGDRWRFDTECVKFLTPQLLSNVNPPHNSNYNYNKNYVRRSHTHI